MYCESNKADKLTKLRNVKSTGETISSFEYDYNWNGNIMRLNVSCTLSFGALVRVKGRNPQMRGWL